MNMHDIWYVTFSVLYSGASTECMEWCPLFRLERLHFTLHGNQYMYVVNGFGACDYNCMCMHACCVAMHLTHIQVDHHLQTLSAKLHSCSY